MFTEDDSEDPLRELARAIGLGGRDRTFPAGFLWGAAIPFLKGGKRGG